MANVITFLNSRNRPAPVAINFMDYRGGHFIDL